MTVDNQSWRRIRDAVQWKESSPPAQPTNSQLQRHGYGHSSTPMIVQGTAAEAIANGAAGDVTVSASETIEGVQNLGPAVALDDDVLVAFVRKDAEHQANPRIIPLVSSTARNIISFPSQAAEPHPTLPRLRYVSTPTTHEVGDAEVTYSDGVFTVKDQQLYMVSIGVIGDFDDVLIGDREWVELRVQNMDPLFDYRVNGLAGETFSIVIESHITAPVLADVTMSLAGSHDQAANTYMAITFELLGPAP